MKRLTKEQVIEKLQNGESMDSNGYFYRMSSGGYVNSYTAEALIDTKKVERKNISLRYTWKK